jgi:superfamily I DNA/RNA helicase
LLDYDQEQVLKTDLDLPTEGQILSKELRIQLVNGVAGSGKTLILLYRLRLLHAMFPGKRFLVLTHNRPLIRDMQFRFDLLNAAPSERINWSTFQGLCLNMLYPGSSRRNLLSLRARDRLVRSVWKDCLQETRITERMFADELGWFKDNGFSGREAYLEADRRGRGFRLVQEQREQMFDAMFEYQKRLFARDQLDWWDVPRRLWHWIEEGTVEPDQYDVVLVDEAQFFAPVWFQIVQRVVLPDLGYLFLAADPTQGFLRRGESWKSVSGLEVRGRSHQLRRSYRTTKAILRCAWTWYQGRVAKGEMELLPPRWSGMQKGRAPFLVQFDSPQDERTWIVNEIAQAVGDGLPARQVLVLHESWQGVNALLEMLNRRLGAGMARDPKDAGSGAWVRVTTINAGTGLESPLVFIAGMGRMFEEEEGLLLAEEDRADLVRQNTRKLYMAFTRAGQRLVLTHTGEVPVSLRRLEEQGLLEAELSQMGQRKQEGIA